MIEDSSSSFTLFPLKTFIAEDSSETATTLRSVSTDTLSAVLCLVPV